VTWGDRAIGIGLGLILGIAAVVLFVFSGGEETIDDPQIDRGPAPIERPADGEQR
jgi:hypothetical protein